MANFQPFNYGQVIGQAENILASQQRRDPNSLDNQYRQAQINALRDEAQNPDSNSTYSKNPTLVRDPQGNIKAYQLSDQGGAKEVDFGGGGVPAVKGVWKDVGNGFQILDPYMGGSQGQAQGGVGQPSPQPNLQDIPSPTLTGQPTTILKGIPPQDEPAFIAKQEAAKLKEQTLAGAEKKKQEMLGSAAAKKAEAGFASVDKIKTNIFNLNDALKAIDAGADTGPIQQYLPTVRSASIELQNVRSRLGLDVVGAVTFGALSKGELDLALNTALPTSKKPEDLRVWINDKIAAQTKLMDYINEQSVFLSQPGNTQAMWAELVKVRKLDPRINRDAGDDFSSMTDEELKAIAEGN